MTPMMSLEILYVEGPYSFTVSQIVIQLVVSLEKLKVLV